MIKDIKEINFPEYATLSQATVSVADMGEKVITTQIKIDGAVVPDFSYDWEVEWKGERYIHTAREPQAAKDNTSIRTSIDLTFKHWAIVQLQRYYFVEMASTEAGTAIADKYIASMGVNLRDFVNALNKVLEYYFGDKFKAVIDPEWIPAEEASFVEINYSYIWDVIQKIYDIYAVRWVIEPSTEVEGGYIIHIGGKAPEASHIFEYGYQGGLLKVERQVQSTDIKNIILGRGGDKNLPYLYFKDYDKYGAGESSDASGSSEKQTIAGVTAATISSLEKYGKTTVKATYTGTFEVAEGKSGVLIAGIPEAEGQTTIGLIPIGGHFHYRDINVVYIALGSPFIRVFNKETNEEVSPVAIKGGAKYYYTWENEVTNNYTDTIYNVKVTLPSLTLITGSGSIIGASLTGNRGFRPDPDAIPELQYIAFTELRSSEFREYVQGWKAAHYDGEVPAEPSEAFIKGLTDEKFNPVEYVKDDESIAKYGEQWGALDNNEDIYPSIQGSGVDDVVAVEEITSDITNTDDEVDTGGIEKIVIGDKEWTNSIDYLYQANATSWTRRVYFTIPSGRKGQVYFGGNINVSAYESRNTVSAGGFYRSIFDFDGEGSSLIDKSDSILNINKVLTVSVPKFYISEKAHVNNVVSQIKNYHSDYLPAGDYCMTVSIQYKMTFNAPPLYNIKAVLSPFVLTTTKDDYQQNKENVDPQTFDIWVKNLWNTEKRADETDKQYAERVWFPIIGQNNLEVTFTSGLLAVSSDYQFTVAKYAYDTSKEHNGERSHWRLTLNKSQAEYEATGLLIPNTRINAKAGDKFFFTNIELPHQYVLWAERRLHDYKVDNLDQVSEIKPTWVVSLDKVRCNNAEQGEVGKLIDQIQVGAALKIAHKFITDSPYNTLYVQSATYTYSEPSENSPALYPDVEIVLSDKIATVTNPVSLMQGEIDALRQQVGGSLSNIEQVLRAYGDKVYLRKDGISDIESGYVRFQRGASFEGQTDFKDDVIIGRDGYVGGLTGFGIRLGRDGAGEMDSLVLRRFLETPEFRYNRVDITIGNAWRAVSYGIVETVIPDTDDEGNQLDSGVIYLKLEDGEPGSVAVDDICMGIFHNETDLESNATTDTDDSKGNFNFAGFQTVYFRVTELLDEGRNGIFRYVLRAPDESWTQKHHPQEGMTFSGYGNFTNKERQTSKYETRTYERYLKDVDDWTFSARNIAAQFGDLSNLGTLLGIDMTGYSIYLNNIYMTGRIQQMNPQGQEVPVITDRGVWSASETYYKNDDVYHNNAKWRCLVDGTKSEPSKTNSAWLLLEEAVSGDSVSIVSQSVSYQVGTSGTTKPTGVWSNDIPSVPRGQYLWTKTEVNYSDGQSTVSYSVAYSPEDGANGTSVTITSTSVTYQKSTSGTTTPTGTWQTSIPTTVAGEYLWTRTVVNYSDGKSTTSYSVAAHGENGKDGASYTENLLLKSNVPHTNTDYPTAVYYFGNEKPVIGETYTFTLKGKLGEGKTVFQLWITGFDDHLCTLNDKGNGLYQSTFTWRHLDGDSLKYVLVFPMPQSVKSESTIEWVKLEKGKVDATNVVWTPNSSEIIGKEGSNYTNNMLLNSNFSKNAENWQTWGNPTIREFVEIDGKTWLHIKTTTTQYQGLQQGGINIHSNAKYTFSALVRGVSNNQVFGVGFHWRNINNVNVSQDWYNTTIGTTPTRLVFHTQASNNSDAVLSNIMIGNGNLNTATEIWITDVKFEEGHNDNPVWTPAASEMIGQDGADGRGITNTINYYAVTTTPTAPNVPSASSAPSSPWQTTPPILTATNKYMWNYERVQYTSGTTWEATTPHIIAVYGDKGEQGDSTVTIYRWDDNEPDTPTGQNHEGWCESTDKVYSIQNGNVWSLRSDGYYQCPQIGNSSITKNTITFIANKPNQVLNIELVVYSEDTYDFALVGYLDRSDVTRTNNYLNRVSGNGNRIVVSVVVPTEGSHFVEVAYATDNSNLYNGNYAMYRAYVSDVCWQSVGIKSGITGNISAWSEPIRLTGLNGHDGSEGMIVRQSEWIAGVEFRNDEDETSTPRYLDVVLVRNDSTPTGWDMYTCKKTHPSSTDNAPTTELGLKDYWDKANTLAPIITPIVFAKNSVINFMQGNRLLIHNSAGTVVGGFLGETTPLFIGSTYENRASAPFRVSQDGSFIATKARLESAYVSGELHSTKGNIGGFEISTDQIVSTSGDDSLLLSSRLLRFMNSDVATYIGSNITPQKLTGFAIGIRSEINREVGSYIGGNIGIYISVEGYNITPDYDSLRNIDAGDHAIYIEKGHIFGFRLRTRRISTSQTLDLMDSIILCYNTSTITITLPSNAEDGQLYVIIRHNSATVSIATSSNASTRYRGGVVTTFSDRYALLVTYDKLNNVWEISGWY